MLLIVFLAGCEVFNPGGQIVFDDFTETSRISGLTGAIDFGEKPVGTGAKAVESLKISNSGSSPLIITNVDVVGSCFQFVDGIKPDLPIEIPSGKTINDIFIEFLPDAAGSFEGMLFIETGSEAYYFSLIGTGLWQLTVTLDSGDDGLVTLPGIVNPGQSVVFESSTGEFELACELDFMREFVEWVVVSTHTADNEPLFGGDADDPALKAGYLKTDLIIRSHTEINPDISNPYVTVSSGGNIQAAINTAAAGTQTAVAVSVGTYTLAGDLDMAEGISLKGGYNAGFTARAYKTPADRSNATYRTVINIGGSISAASEAISDDVVIEGFTINKTATAGPGYDQAILLDSSSAGVYYNTVNSSGFAAGIHVTDSSKSVISGNVITAGDTTADYSETYGIMVTEESDPVLYKNIITGGSAGGTNSTAYGVFCDFDCVVKLIGNTIDAGSGTESYGIYMINNGKVIADYNDINGGRGTTAYALFTNYGGNLYLTHNNIYTSGGDARYGVVAGFSGRLRLLTDSGIYDCESGLISTYLGGAVTQIDDVNDYFNTDTNIDSAITISAVSEAAYE